MNPPEIPPLYRLWTTRYIKPERGVEAIPPQGSEAGQGGSKMDHGARPHAVMLNPKAQHSGAATAAMATIPYIFTTAEIVKW